MAADGGAEVITFGIIALILLAGQYAYALLTATTEQNKTPVIQWTWTMRRHRAKDGSETEEPVGKKLVTLELRELSETEKRRRFLWFALTSLPAMLFLLMYLLQ